MTMKHSPEPWKVGERRIVGGMHDIDETRVADANGEAVADFDNGYMKDRTHNAARAVACVNALAGIEDPQRWVEMANTLMVLRGTHPNGYENLVRELVEAAKEAHGKLDHAESYGCDTEDERNLLADAISRLDPEWRP